jgi:NADH-quinone oxidoreductase subunit G
LHQSASSVGNLILGLQSNEIEKIYSSEVLYLLNADEIDPKKLKNKFVIYQGTHGGESSQIADVVLPGAAYSEKNGSFVNLEGRVQKSFKASYPPGFAKEDWEIFLEISNYKNINLGFDSFESLRELMLKEYSRLGNYDQLPETDLDKIKIDRHVKKDFKVDIDLIDYYQSNIIARASTTMSECKNSKTLNKKTGTEN